MCKLYNIVRHSVLTTHVLGYFEFVLEVFVDNMMGYLRFLGFKIASGSAASHTILQRFEADNVLLIMLSRLLKLISL